MSRRRPHLLLVLTIVLLSAGGVAAQTPRAIELRADSLLVNSAAQTVEARGRVRISDGRVTAAAPRAVYYVVQRRIVLTSGVTVTSPDGTLRSREATVFLSRGNTIERLDAQGGVVARSGARALSAQRLGYVPAADRLTAAGQVQLSVPAGVATGHTLSADLRRNTGTLTAARIRTREGTIAGDRLDVDGTNRQAFLRGHVTGAFSGTALTSDTATVYEREKKIVFRGKVTVTRPGRILQADVVTFFYEENRLIAEGQTRITIQETP